VLISLPFVAHAKPPFLQQGVSLRADKIAAKESLMAQYKHSQYLTKSDSTAFDAKHAPGSTASNPGIYRCAGCGDEIGIAKGHTLPPQNHHQHTPSTTKVEWQLLVFAQQKK